MSDPIDATMVSVRADTQAFARDVAVLRSELEATLGDGALRAGLKIETALARALSTGRLGFEDLGRVALKVLSDIATAAIRTQFGGSGGDAGDGGLSALLASALGAPGRATGGPVSPGRAYIVGERGPEVFVPTASGAIATGSAGARDVRVSITVRAEGGAAPGVLERSSRQVARAVRAALSEE